LAADAQLAFGGKGKYGVPLELGQDERWRDLSYDPVEQAGQQRIALGTNRPAAMSAA
jgi:hypothetical protein